MWGGYKSSDIFNSLERLQCREAKKIFSLQRDMPFAEVLELALWPKALHSHYILDVFKHIHRAFNERLPEILPSRIIVYK